jgi:predicted ribosomally synthesized peptide with SipW-like signal peptide
MRFKFNKRAALLVAVIILCIWSILGTGATVAWFTDTGEVVQNDFAVGTLEMEVEYRNETMLHYEPVTQTKGIFNDGALYEPGYTQVVYLKITNTGDQPFDLRLSVDSVDWFDSISVLGNTLHLPDYLKFALQHCLTNIMCVPDFVAYKFADRNDTISVKLCRKLWKAEVVTWTLKTKEEYDTAVTEGWIPIFENFIP